MTSERSLEASEELPRIDSPLHQLRQLDEAVTDTGTGIVVVFSIDDFADCLAGLTKEEIVDELRRLAEVPEDVMGDRPENSLPIMPLFAFVEQGVANELVALVPDSKPEPLQDE